MMEEKPIKSRHKQLTWKQPKTMETKQEMPVLGKHATIQGMCRREDLLGSGAWHSPTQHFTDALGPAWAELWSGKSAFPGSQGSTFMLATDTCT